MMSLFKAENLISFYALSKSVEVFILEEIIKLASELDHIVCRKEGV